MSGPYETNLPGRDGRRKLRDRRGGDPWPEYLLPFAGDGVEGDRFLADYMAVNLVYACVARDRTLKWVESHLEDCPHLPAVFEDHTRAALVTELDEHIRKLRRLREIMAAPVRDCERCGLRFTGRADARYCSTGCRVAAHRERNASVPAKT